MDCGSRATSGSTAATLAPGRLAVRLQGYPCLGLGPSTFKVSHDSPRSFFQALAAKCFAAFAYLAIGSLPKTPILLVFVFTKLPREHAGNIFSVDRPWNIRVASPGSALAYERLFSGWLAAPRGAQGGTDGGDLRWKKTMFARELPRYLHPIFPWGLGR